MKQHVEGVAGPARIASWGALAVGVAGVMIFGSVVTGIGDWMEGRQLRTVGSWAVPGLLLAAVAGTVAIRALWTGKGYLVAVSLALAVMSSVILMYVLNPSIAPPVP